MPKTPIQVPPIGWLRERFGIDDEAELRALLSDPSEMLALFDVARAADSENAPKQARPAAHV